jgi:hypothetical protein
MTKLSELKTFVQGQRVNSNVFDSLIDGVREEALESGVAIDPTFTGNRPNTGVAFGSSANTQAGVAPVLQAESTTIATQATAGGILVVRVTSALLSGGQKDIPITVTTGAIGAVGAEVRAALALDNDIDTHFVVSGADENIILTAKVDAADDATLAFSLITDGDTGVTVGASGDTVAGVAAVLQIETATVGVAAAAPGTLQVRITSALLDGGYKDVPIAVATSNQSAVALYIRDELADDVDIDTHFTVSGSTANIILTAKVAAADDATLAIAIQDADGTSVALSGASANTAAGVAPVLQVETIEVLTADGYAGTLGMTITSALLGGGNNAITVDLLTTDNTVDLVATKIRAALADGEIETHYTIGGSAAEITLTAIVAAANDATLDIALDTVGASGVTLGASVDAVSNVTGVVQIETIEVTTGASVSEELSFKVTSALLTGGSQQVDLEVLEDDTVSQVAAKIRAALPLNSEINAGFTIGGSGAFVILTAKASAANDATLAMAIVTGETATDALILFTDSDGNITSTTVSVLKIISLEIGTYDITTDQATLTPDTLEVTGNAILELGIAF